MSAQRGGAERAEGEEKKQTKRINAEVAEAQRAEKEKITGSRDPLKGIAALLFSYFLQKYRRSVSLALRVSASLRTLR